MNFESPIRSPMEAGPLQPPQLFHQLPNQQQNVGATGEVLMLNRTRVLMGGFRSGAIFTSSHWHRDSKEKPEFSNIQQQPFIY
jgi:hypothetical protein